MRDALALTRPGGDPGPAGRVYRAWRALAEAVVFAAAEQAKRDTLARLVGRDCPLDLLMDDIRAELSGRPYELVKVGGDYALCTRVRYADAIRAAFVIDPEVRGLSKLEAGVLAAIAYEQPITRADLSERLGREIGRDLIASLRGTALIAPGGRARQDPVRPSPISRQRDFWKCSGWSRLEICPISKPCRTPLWPLARGGDPDPVPNRSDCRFKARPFATLPPIPTCEKSSRVDNDSCSQRSANGLGYM